MNKMREEFWTSVLAMVFAELREPGSRDEVLNIGVRTGRGDLRLGDVLPFSPQVEVWMHGDLHKALEERAAEQRQDRDAVPADCKGQPDLWVEDANNVLLVENKTRANRRSQQEDQYRRCLESPQAFAGKKKAFFYVIPRSYLGPRNVWERFLTAGGDADVTRGLLLWDELKGTVKDVLGLSEWFLQGFPS